MGYRDDFYKKENIIGHTGTIGENETVYFKKDEEFGHITQDHDFITNIGRETVDSADDYKIENNKAGKAEEYANGEVLHKSRNAFVPIEEDERDTLAEAIARHQNEKAYPNYTVLLIEANGDTFLDTNEEKLSGIGTIKDMPGDLKEVKLEDVTLHENLSKKIKNVIKRLQEEGYLS